MNYVRPNVKTTGKDDINMESDSGVNIWHWVDVVVAVVGGAVAVVDVVVPGVDSTESK